MMSVPLAPLARFVARPGAPGSPGARCRLCREPIDGDDGRHAHVVDLVDRTILCACATCCRLLAQPGAGGGRYRAVPDRVLVDPGHPLDQARWAELGIPVRLAFVFLNSGLDRWIAQYPSAAGAAEAELSPEPWRAFAAATPLVAAIEPDVEALLVHGRREGDLESFVVPIDACYRLVGRLRRTWRGFQGGDEAWRHIDGTFADLRARARPIAPGARAEAAP